MTNTTILPNGNRASLLSPEHRMLRRMFEHAGPTYYPAQQGATVTQLRAAARRKLVTLVRSGFEILGAHLTAAGEARLEMLDDEVARRDLIERRAAGDLS